MTIRYRRSSAPRRTEYIAEDTTKWDDANDSWKVLATAAINHAHTTQLTEYPTHPSIRQARASASVPVTHSYDSDSMRGVRGPQADHNYMVQSYDKDWAAASTRPGETIPMFQHRSQRVPPRVDELYTLKGSQSLSVPLLGIAQRDSVRRGDGPLVPSTNLSEHSAPMVEKFNRNLGTQFRAERENAVTFPTEIYTDHMEGLHDIMPNEVEAGRRLGRSALRRPKARQTGEQLRLT